MAHSEVEWPSQQNIWIFSYFTALLVPPCQWCRRQGASVPPKILVCWKSGQNPWKYGTQIVWLQKIVPNFAEEHMETFFGDHNKNVFVIFVGENF